MMKFLGNNKLLVLFFAMALAHGFLWLDFSAPVILEQGSFDITALEILKGAGFNYETGYNALTREPGFPIFIAGVYSIFGYLSGMVRVIQIFLFAGLGVLAYALLKKLFSKPAALISSFFLSLCVPVAAYSNEFNREFFMTFMVFLVVYCLYQIRISEEKMRWFVISGLALSFLVMIKIVFSAFVFLVLINFLGEYRKRIFTKRVGLGILLFCLIIGSTYFLYFTRNASFWDRERPIKDFEPEYQVDHSVHYKATFARVLWENKLGNLAGNLLGFYFVPELVKDGQYPDEVAKYDQADYITMFEEQGLGFREIGKILEVESREYIKENPEKYAFACVISFLRLNNPAILGSRLYQLFAGDNQELSKSAIILGFRLIWFVFWGFMIYGVVKNRRNLRKLDWILLMIIYINAIYTLVHTNPRHGTPLYPLYFVLFSLGVYMFLKKKNFLRHSFFRCDSRSSTGQVIKD
ncbi:glycosyltransferase family 39 protein [Candidatus Falkowbacteria bacterium]|nr:glycosyltransferase family 39 protein [Candidatus Falkowbacteria bacterium]